MGTERICPSCHRPLPPEVPLGLCPECLMKAGLSTGTEPAGPGPKRPAFVPPSVEEMARLFPQFEILELIGKGGMGAVYKARQPALDRFVAIKILPPDAASAPGFTERFTREARALARLNHPNIVTVHDFGQAGPLHYLVMEFVDGANLRQVEAAGRLAPEQALAIVPQICDALQYAHNEGIVHRDIKPENILVDKRGKVKITDFGIAKILGVAAGQAPLTGARDVMGTPHYMAPEQVESPQTVDHRADIYSLGVVFYEMLTGQLPLGKFALPSKKVRIDVRLDDVVLRALEHEPELRYQQASQVKTAVETISSTPAPRPGENPASSPSGPAGSAPPDADALLREILSRDYVLNITSCLRRGWALVRQDLWPVIGVTALILLFLSAVSSSGNALRFSQDASVSINAIGILLSGPLMGGLWFYYLKRTRGESVRVETAFSGFSGFPHPFLQLALGSFVAEVLTVLGLICLILPGIYLVVAWMFTLPLIIDKRLDFWQAMQLSRKAISKHWWKFLALLIVLGLLNLAGILLLFVGVLFTFPVTLAALMFAYEDIFRPATAGQPAGQPAPVAPAPPQAPASGFNLFLGILLALFVAVCSVSAFLTFNQLKPFLLALVAAGVLVLGMVLLLRKCPSIDAFLTPFFLVFLLVFGFGAFSTSIMPESYVGTARVKLMASGAEASGPTASAAGSGAYDPHLLLTESQVLQSEVILTPVIESLDLNREWGWLYAGGETLKTTESMALLRARMSVRPVGQTSLLAISVYDEKPEQAARIANELAQVYRNRNNLVTGQGPLRVDIVEPAVPGLRPVRPNRPLNLSLAALFGLPLGLAAGAAGLALRARKKLRLPRGFLLPFSLVFVLVFGAGAAITFILPESYVGTARLKLAPHATRFVETTGASGARATYDLNPVATECEVLQSETIVSQVIQALALDQAWGKRYAGGSALKPAETIALLKARLTVHPVRNTSVIEIQVFDSEPDEGARIANELAQVYRNRNERLEAPASKSGGIDVEIIDHATPGLRAVRPNKPLNLLLAALAGVVLGTVVGAARAAFKAAKAQDGSATASQGQGMNP